MRISKEDISLVDALIQAAYENICQQDQGKEHKEAAALAEAEAREALLKHILKLRNAKAHSQIEKR